MSRIGKIPIPLPAGVTAAIEGSVVRVKGPKGELARPLSGTVTAKVEGGKVVNRTTGMSWDVVPLPPARQAIIDAGGLIAYTRKRMLEAQARA